MVLRRVLSLYAAVPECRSREEAEKNVKHGTGTTRRHLGFITFSLVAYLIVFIVEAESRNMTSHSRSIWLAVCWLVGW